MLGLEFKIKLFTFYLITILKSFICDFKNSYFIYKSMLDFMLTFVFTLFFIITFSICLLLLHSTATYTFKVE